MPLPLRFLFLLSLSVLRHGFHPLYVMEKKVIVKEESADTFQWGRATVMMVLIMMFLTASLYILSQSLS